MISSPKNIMNTHPTNFRIQAPASRGFPSSCTEDDIWKSPCTGLLFGATGDWPVEIYLRTRTRPAGGTTTTRG